MFQFGVRKKVLFSTNISIRFNALADAGGLDPIRAIDVVISAAGGSPAEAPHYWKGAVWL
jgi:hypothetical protein